MIEVLTTSIPFVWRFFLISLVDPLLMQYRMILTNNTRRAILPTTT